LSYMQDKDRSDRCRRLKIRRPCFRWI